MKSGELEASPASVALIVGVTGMVGLSLVEALKKPKALGTPWKVYGIARRDLPCWFPSSLLDNFISFDALDQQTTTEKLTPFASHVTHVFWVVLQRRESEEANIVLNSTMLSNVLSVLKSASPSRLRHITLLTGTKHYMGPIFDPKFADQLQVICQDPPFKEGLPRLPYPNFYYVLEDLIASHSPSVSYSVHRSSIILGASSTSFRNTLLALCVYATICKYKRLPFKFPGSKYTWEHFFDMSDARVLAEQQIWAAVTDKAKNQAFNCTNGDVFTWRSFWKVLCEILNVEFVEFDENDKFDWVEMMRDKGQVWDEIVEKYELYKTKMEDIICFEALSVVLHLRIQHVCSMNKSREFGFFGFVDTFKGTRMWVERLRDMKIIP